MVSLPGRVERIVETTLDCPIRSCARPAGGRIAETYLLRLDGDPGRAVCKLGGPSVRTGDVVEPHVIGLVATTTDLPVPAVLASGTLQDGTAAGTRWALYEFCDGHSPTPYRSLDASVRHRIVTETGSVLGRLHEAHQFERTGGLALADGQLRVATPDGLNFPERGRELARHHPSWDGRSGQPVLSHGDLFPGNLLVDDDGTITGLLDWGNAHVTTAGYELARAELRFIDWFRLPVSKQRELRTALRDSYRQHRSLPPEYPALTGLYKTSWLAQSADRIGRHLTSTRGRNQLKRHLASLVPRLEQTLDH